MNYNHVGYSLLASSPVWASKTGLARTRERAAKPRGAEAPHSRVLARLASLAQIGELARRLRWVMAFHFRQNSMFHFTLYFAQSIVHLVFVI